MSDPINPPSPAGGSSFGVHFLSDFSSCPTKWYWRNLALWPGVYLSVGNDGSISGDIPIGGRPSIGRDSLSNLGPEAAEGPSVQSQGMPVGITPARFKPALDTGSRVHAGVAAFYQYGCRDGVDTGERSLSAMLDAARLDPPISGEPDTDLVESLALTDRMLTRYFETYKGDDGVRVAFDKDGHPLIEREFWLDLGYRDYRFTCRADLVYWQSGQYLRFMEHKTARASDLPKWLKRADIDPQFTGQFLMGVSHFPDDPFDGVTLNALVKDRAKKSDLPDMMRKTYSRSPAQLEKFRLDAVRRLQRIDESVEEWRTLVKQGMEPDDAAKVVFDGSPSGYECVGMGVACDYLGLCVNRERLSSLLLDSYEPRHYKYEWENPLRKGLK